MLWIFYIEDVYIVQLCEWLFWVLIFECTEFCICSLVYICVVAMCGGERERALWPQKPKFSLHIEKKARNQSEGPNVWVWINTVLTAIRTSHSSSESASTSSRSSLHTFFATLARRRLNSEPKRSICSNLWWVYLNFCLQNKFVSFGRKSFIFCLLHHTEKTFHTHNNT